MRFAEMLIEPNQEEINEPDHECNGDHCPDNDICRGCKEHSGYCTECGLSECCGESPVRP